MHKSLDKQLVRTMLVLLEEEDERLVCVQGEGVQWEQQDGGGVA